MTEHLRFRTVTARGNVTFRDGPAPSPDGLHSRNLRSPPHKARAVEGARLLACLWPLLLLVSCLFALTGQLNDAGIAARVLAFLDDNQLLPNNLLLLLPFAAMTSNAIGSVPTAMLLLQVCTIYKCYSSCCANGLT